MITRVITLLLAGAVSAEVAILSYSCCDTGRSRNTISQPRCLKKVVCPTKPSLRRAGEGDIIVLKDGRLMLIYSCFLSGTGQGPEQSGLGDDSPAEIWRCYSKDGGRTWGQSSRFVANDAMNLMSVSLLRLKNEKLMMVYGRRYSNADMRWYARFSSDEGQTWSSDHIITPLQRYQTINNARIIQLKNGRLLAPGTICRGETWMQDFFFYGIVHYSDDNGRTWRTGEQRLSVENCGYGFDEPGVVELKDGRVMMFIRTDIGKIYRSYSTDSGKTWSKPERTDLNSPSSPATITRIPSTGDLLVVWNNASPLKENVGQPRSPLTTAISRDEGKTWEHIKNLEDTPGGDYCYTSVTFVGKDAILTYYERGSLKVAVVAVEWFYE